MPGLETLLAFTAAALVMNLSPGPSNFYVLSRSLAQGTPAGLVAAAGLAVGSLGHVAAAALGLSAILLYSPAAYAVLQVAGAGYLVYLGLLRLLPAERSPDAPDAPDARGPRAPRGQLGPQGPRGRRGATAPKSFRKIFWQSGLVELLNPKTALFFLAFLPHFADIEAGPLAPQILVLGLIVTLTALPCDAAVAALSGRAGRLLSASSPARRLLDWMSGSILIGLGAFLAFGRHPEG